MQALSCSPELERPPFLPWGLDVLAQPPHPSYLPLWQVLRQRAVWKRRWRGLDLDDMFLPAAEIERAVDERRLPDGTTVITTTLRGPGGSLTSVSQGIAGTWAFESTRRFLSSADDVRLYLSWPFASPAAEGASFAALDAEVGGRGVVTWRIPDALGVVGHSFEPEPFALCSVEAPGIILRLLDVIAARIYAYVEAVLREGARPIVIIGGPEFATPPLLSPRTFDDYVVRFDQPLIDLLHRCGCKVIVHCHGRLDSVLERFVQMGVDALHPFEAPPMGDITPAEAKRRVGRRMCLVGNLQIGDMMTMAPSEIKRQARQLRQSVPDGLIVTTTATPYETPMSQRLFENYQAAFDALDE